MQDPNLALLIIVCGISSVYVEVLRPGLVLPGVCGSALTLLGLATLSAMPITWAGVLLIIGALILLGVGVATGLEVFFVVLSVMFMTSGLIELVRGPKTIAAMGAAAASGLVCPALELLLVSSVRARENKQVI